MSAMQQYPAVPIRPAVPPQTRPPARKKPPVAKGPAIHRQPKEADSPASNWDVFAAPFVAIPAVFFTDVLPQLSKAECDLLLAIGRLTYGQKRGRSDELKRQTDLMTLALLCSQANLDRRTGDQVIEFLLAFGLIGRGGKTGTRYHFWLLPENWKSWKRPEKAAEVAEDEDVDGETEGEETEKKIGGAVPIFGSAVQIQCGKRTKPLALDECKEQLNELQYDNGSASPLSIEHAFKAGRLIVSIRDLQPQKAAQSRSCNGQLPAHSPSFNDQIPTKSHNGELKEVRLLLNTLLRDQGKMEPATDVLCNQVLHIRGRATLAEIRIKIAARSHKLKFVTPGLVLDMVKECAGAADSAHRDALADQALCNARQAREEDAAAREMAEAYASGDEEHRAWMREKLGYKP